MDPWCIFANMYLEQQQQQMLPDGISFVVIELFLLTDYRDNILNLVLSSFPTPQN